MRVALFNYMASGWVAFDDVQVIPLPLVTKYYYFNGQRIAMRQDGELTYLHGDHLGSTVMTTDASGNDTAQKYHAFGSVRDGGGLATDHTFTGQKVDGTGLLYYNARYYDPLIGQFISPDSIVLGPLNQWKKWVYNLTVDEVQTLKKGQQDTKHLADPFSF